MQLQKTSARRKLFIFKDIQDMTLCEIEAVAQRCFIRKDVLRKQENTFAGVPFLIKLHA